MKVFRSDGARLLYFTAVALLGALVLRPAGALTLSDIAFLMSMTVAIPVAVLDRSSMPLRIPRVILFGATLFALGAVASSIRAHAPVESLSVAARFVYIVVPWFWLGTAVLKTLAHARAALQLWCLSAAASATGAIVQALAGNVIPGTSIFDGRMTGLTQHPNDLGGLMAIALVPALMFATEPGDNIRHRLVRVATAVLVLVGLLLSGSVGGFAAALVSTVVWLVFDLNRRSILVVAVAMALVTALTIGVELSNVAVSPLRRITQVSGDAANPASTLHSRLENIRSTVDSLEEDPILGRGFDSTGSLLPSGELVHDSLLASWYGAGLAGFAGMLSILVGAIRTGVLVLRRAHESLARRTAVALFCSMVAFMIFGLGAPVLYQRYGWIGIALLIVIWAIRPIRSRGSGQASPQDPGPAADSRGTQT